MNTKLFEQLQTLSQQELATMLAKIYGMSHRVDDFIDLQVSRQQPSEIKKLIAKRISSIRRGTRFIPYHEATKFAQQLDAIVEDIEILIDSSPQLAVDLLDRFIALHGGVYERVDDSSGELSCTFHAAVSLWLKAAAKWRQQDADSKVEWPQEFIVRYQNNDYAVWDDLFAESAELLTEAELHHLADHYRAEILKNMKAAAENSDWETMKACCALRGIAKALQSVELFEQSILLKSPQPNGLQKESIVKFCLDLGQHEAAMKWLQEPWEARFDYIYRDLMDQTLKARGDIERLRQLRREKYEKIPSYHNLSKLLECESEEVKASIRTLAVEKILSHDTLEDVLDTLIKLERIDLAAQQCIEREEELAEVLYFHLTDWAQTFANSDHLLASVVCYRHLLLQILSAARSKAYHHAATYYQQLCKLDQRIDSYQSLVDHSGFHNELKINHGRKSAFWGKLKVG